MATPWTHAFFALATGKSLIHRRMPLRFWVLTAVCAAVPDIDFFWRKLVANGAGMWGHRGITHSLMAAMLFGVLAAWIYQMLRPIKGLAQAGMDTGGEGPASAALRKTLIAPHELGRPMAPTRVFLLLWLAFALATASHAMLDMLTRARGVALLAPFYDHRCDFAWQPIWSLPRWVQQEFPNLTRHGHLILSEAVVVWLPMTALLACSRWFRGVRGKHHNGAAGAGQIGSRKASTPVESAPRPPAH